MNLIVTTHPDNVLPRHSEHIILALFCAPGQVENPGPVVSVRKSNAVRIYPVNGHIDTELMAASILVPAAVGQALLDMDTTYCDFDVYTATDELRIAYPQTEALADDDGNTVVMQEPVTNWGQKWS